MCVLIVFLPDLTGFAGGTVLQVEHQCVAEEILIFSLTLEKWLNLYNIFPSINHINHKAPKTFC